MKRLKYSILIVLLSALCVSCGEKKAKKQGGLQGEISISGAFALYPLVVKWADEFQKIHPNVSIDITGGGAGKGMTDVLSGIADVAMVSRDISPSEKEKGALEFAVAKDAVVAVANKKNPILDSLLKHGISCEKAARLWTTEEVTRWGEILELPKDYPIHIYTRSDACGAAETWAGWFHSKQEDLTGTGVFGDPGIASAVQKDALGIGFNNMAYAYDLTTGEVNPGLVVVPLDINGNGMIDAEEAFFDHKDRIMQAIIDGRYPAPPARDLYLVTKGIPKNPALVEFLKFILTEGQVHNTPTGFVPMTEEKLSEALKQLPQNDTQPAVTNMPTTAGESKK